MAAFATVVAISSSGKVFAVNAHGVQREVLVNDSVEMGETIKTMGDVQVELVLDDQRSLHLLSGQIVQLEDSAFLPEQTPSATDAAAPLAPPAPAQTIIEALNRGQDLSTALDATAAGPGDADGGGGGSSFVQLGRVSESVSGNTYGFDFQGL
ncbi:MAG: retention module-containing protein, partial [Rhodoferax sp.]|nr:retention module-containing protein [Rhodoferax sp.]